MYDFDVYPKLDIIKSKLSLYRYVKTSCSIKYINYSIIGKNDVKLRIFCIPNNDHRADEFTRLTFLRE